MGLPFLWPPDYHAEIFTDAHMEKLSRLLEKKKWIEEAEERRKAREAKRNAKEVQAQKLKERASSKKQEMESVKKLRKQRQQSGFADGGKGIEKMGLDFEDGKRFRALRRGLVWPRRRHGERV
ncbi:putative rRNA-processing protein EBP2 [Cinnamomum micranthum f. kanehirae]|uniref:Putative rRNA-processing protein EBP2 n=1 Tax=Cinnamomum micranthum f. kanehirae TaxID=337451 RepID=A0A3S3MDP4_9MAGN|nr:putative rRNA-processing protein EBP2 [Cinnamomum micranthum f. kanehirae]